ncbi:MAG: hypothetical protein ORN49_05495 [Rhodobacteraceae bacterium]|nr:hypothetical protein [Paracoccaceae bacterium]
MSEEFLDKFHKIPGDWPAGIEDLQKVLEAERVAAQGTAQARQRYRRPQADGPSAVFSVRIPFATRAAIERYAAARGLTLGQALTEIVAHSAEA